MPRVLINTVKNNTQFKLSRLHDYYLNDLDFKYKHLIQKTLLFTLYILKNKSQKHLFCKGDSCTKK